MRKTRLFISGMVGFWLWLAGLPTSHDTAGQWLAGELPRAHAHVISGNEISGTVDADFTVYGFLYVNPSLTVDPGAKLTLAAGASLQPTVAGVTTLTNNGTVETYNNTASGLSVVNNGTFNILGAGYTTGGLGIFTNTSTGTVTIDAAMNPFHLENTGIITNNNYLAIGNAGQVSNNNSGGVIINNSNMVINTSLNNNSQGRVIDGQTVYGLTNYGTLNFFGGILTNSGTIMNAAGGTFTSARIFNNEAGGLLINNGTMISSNANNYKEITNRGTIENRGTFTTMGGTTLDNYGTLTNYTGGTVDSQGSITNSAGATITNSGTFTSGYFTNNGTVANYGTFNTFSPMGGGINNGTFTNTGAITGYIINYNTLTNSGTIGNFTNFGSITNTASGVIVVTIYSDHKSGELLNNGRIVNSGTYRSYNDPTTGDGPANPLRAALLTNNGSFTNNAGATFENMGGATFSNNGTLYNYGSFTNTEWSVQNVPTPGTMTNTGAIYNYGAMTNRDGSTFTSGGGLYNYGTFTNAAGSTLTVTAGTVYGPIVNNGTFNVSGGTFTLPSAGQSLSITNLSGAAAFRVAGITAAGAPVTVTASAAGSHTLTVTGGSSAAGQLKAVDLPAGSVATFTGGGDVGAYYCTLAPGSALGLDAEDYYFSSSGQPSSLSKAAMGTTGSTTTVWYGEMNEIRKRMGELRMGTQSSGDFWARAYASKFTIRPTGAASSRQNMRGFELGKDNPQSFAGGKKYTGLGLSAELGKRFERGNGVFVEPAAASGRIKAAPAGNSTAKSPG
jgi:hypothetical protein